MLIWRVIFPISQAYHPYILNANCIMQSFRSCNLDLGRAICENIRQIVQTSRIVFCMGILSFSMFSKAMCMLNIDFEIVSQWNNNFSFRKMHFEGVGYQRKFVNTLLSAGYSIEQYIHLCSWPDVIWKHFEHICDYLLTVN